MAHILAAGGIEFDIETQCVIVGAGACGLVSALRLAEAGVATIVLERDARASGSTSMSSGFIPAAGTRQQQRQSITDSTEQFAADIQTKARDEADPGVVKAVAENVGLALDWLEQKHDFRWIVLDDFLYPGHSSYRMHSVPGKTGAALQNALLAACANFEIDIVTQAKVDALIVQGGANGTGQVALPGAATNVDFLDSVQKVCGVRVCRPDGTLETIRAEKIILACNGYGANRELMQRFIPEMADAYYHGHAGNTGDAVLWGEGLGIPSAHTGAYQGHGSVAAGYHILITWALMMAGGIQVNQHGVRFSNEHQGYSEQAVNVMSQPGSVAWNIYDQRLHELGMGFPDYQQANAAGAVKQATDIAALASITSTPQSALISTLNAIAAYADNASSDSFGRSFKQDQKLQAPYYTVKVIPTVFHTQGGLTIDSNARVIHGSGRPVDELLAAGGAACGVSGSSVSGYLSGNGLLTAVGLGFIAADTVIQDLSEGRK